MELTFTVGLAASLVTILGAAASGIRYLGRAETVRVVADRLGVDLASLVIPEEGRNEWLKRTFDSDTLLVASVESKEEEDDVPAIATEAAVSCGSPMLIKTAVAFDKSQPPREILGEHLTDSDIEAMAEERNVWPNPIERVIRIDDDPSCAYAWLLSDDATEEDRHSLKAEMEEMYVKSNAKEPESLHFIVNNIDEIRELDSETVETYVKPWLNDMDNTEDNR